MIYCNIAFKLNVILVHNDATNDGGLKHGPRPLTSTNNVKYITNMIGLCDFAKKFHDSSDVTNNAALLNKTLYNWCSDIPLPRSQKSKWRSRIKHSCASRHCSAFGVVRVRVCIRMSFEMLGGRRREVGGRANKVQDQLSHRLWLLFLPSLLCSPL